MRMVPVREAKAKFSELIEAAENGEEIMITRNGKPAARLLSSTTSVAAAKAPQKSFLEFLKEFPGGVEFERDRSPSREVDF